ncbi:MAG TPA: Cof-type HAD-IIB family hydrolase [Pseudogracilibacillus sp.]|nr:Cof-type HAD-IIB family hydrolase [Pseudogracilibacillus sp.]
MTNIKLIALDMDGTLLNDDGIVTSYTSHVIQRALQQEIQVVLSTGRPLPLCETYAEELQLTSYIITSNGAEIWTAKHELIEKHVLDAEKINALWEIGNKRRLHMWLVATDKVFRNAERPGNFTDYEWLKIGYGNLTETTKRELLQELNKKKDLEITNSSLTNIEINKEGVNKASALRSICNEIGITMDEVMAVGDSLNDLKMIEQAGLGIAVKNAQQLIREAADFVTATNNDDGVAKAIEKFVLAE